MSKRHKIRWHLDYWISGIWRAICWISLYFFAVRILVCNWNVIWILNIWPWWFFSSLWNYEWWGQLGRFGLNHNSLKDVVSRFFEVVWCGFCVTNGRKRFKTVISREKRLKLRTKNSKKFIYIKCQAIFTFTLQVSNAKPFHKIYIFITRQIEASNFVFHLQKTTKTRINKPSFILDVFQPTIFHLNEFNMQFFSVF